MDLATILQRLGLAAALGLLIGMQRQRAHSEVAGIRTFALIALAGALAALLAERFGGWTVAAGLIGVVAMLVIGNVRAAAIPVASASGITTEIAALVVYGLGAYLMHGQLTVAVVTAGGMVLLLHWKEALHDFVGRLGAKDVNAIMQFVLIALVILPVLPDRTYGPYQVLNPFDIWRMVVLIVGIGLGGYIAYKVLGERLGTVLGGVIGGLVSSTVTTVSFARRVRATPAAVGLAAFVVVVASTVALVRVLILLGMVAPGSFRVMALPIAVLVGVLAVAAVVLCLWHGRESVALPEQANPAEVRPALIFGGIYALVILAVAATKAHFGTSGLYVVAMVSGLTDMDALTLSTARLVADGKLAADPAWRIVMVAVMANLVFKGAAAAVLGGRRLGWRVGAAFAVAVLAGMALILFWPVAATP